MQGLCYRKQLQNRRPAKQDHHDFSRFCMVSLCGSHGNGDRNAIGFVYPDYITCVCRISDIFSLATYIWSMKTFFLTAYNYFT
uniref:Uncharacterized protein n=1 Tax=Oryza brachyantha TaxID=4533 RepID=J3N6H1_ORYBR